MKKLALLSQLTLAMVLSLCAFGQSVSLSLTQQPCNNNGIVTANITGMTTPLTVTWYTAGGSTQHTNVTTLTDVFNNYGGGAISVNVRDANNLYAWTSSQGWSPFTYQTTVNNAVCPNLGSATATVTGGQSPYTYSWYTIPGNTVVSTNATATNLPTGGYGVEITDANGCKYGSAQTGDSIYVYQSTTVDFSLTTTAANCTNGTATISNVTGASTPVTYLWSNNATTTSITGLTKGYYTATVTDAQGCSRTKWASIQQAVNINPQITPTPATCLQNDGAAIAFGSGGVPPYTYLWSNTATTQSISNLTAGYYKVKVTDANGCFGERGVSVQASTPITVTYSAVASACTTANGSATLSISGGQTPYTVQWYTSPGQTGTTAINLAAGTYSFKVTDANGCVRTGTAVVPPVNQLNLQVSSTNTNCTQNTGTAHANISGGTPPYSYLWSNSATTPTINQLGAGGYSVTVTDNIGCSVTKGASVGINSPVRVGTATTRASCIYNSDGSITANAWGGTAPYTYNWGAQGSNQTISNLKTGWYYVGVTDANGCRASKRTYVGYNASNNSCYCTITGTVYNDANNNCVQDAGEQGIPNIQIYCSGQGYVYTNSNGEYSFRVPSGSYKITQTVLGFYPLASCQNNGINVNVTAAANCSTTVDFANTINPIHDMHISTWNGSCAVPGYQYRQVCLITNRGTVAESSVAAGYRTDGQILTPTFSPGNIFTGAGNWYNIPANTLSLNPGQSRRFNVYYNVPTNIPINTQLVFNDTTAYQHPISNWLQDYSPWNNVKRYTPRVVGSYDPNFKEVYPIGDGPTGKITVKDSVLEYMVHFQNLGNYKAQQVYILDTLDNDLDWTTLRPLYQSHDCEITISENGVVRFQFDNIDLPPKSQDEELSNGLVTYTIHTKQGLPFGTQFTNSAAIYFDFNEPVITNTTVNTLVDDVSVAEIAKNGESGVIVYPNPTSDVFTIKQVDKTYTTARVMNLMGQTITTVQINGEYTQVNMGNAAQGVYFILLDGPNGTAIEKIEKL